jgi:cold shock CspA family protein
MSTSTTNVSTSPLLTGQVKWFNNKAGFGFITVLNEHNALSGKEIFVHYTSIDVKNNQYKYLVQGEYVEFFLVKLDGGDHEFHAVNVHGIKGGNLMCETRKQTNEERSTRPAKETARKEVAAEVVAEVRRRTTARRPTVPRPKKTETTAAPTTDDGEYKKVVRKRSAKSVKNAELVEVGVR